ncbi:peptidoglycan-binding protein [Nostocales cyanobacterium LEGE 11386]|nr:peptidoglycan-binding protein [Nostocales cyanobacterium LEGE 11386]
MTFITNPSNGTDPQNQPILREGATGEAVKKLQRLLKRYLIYSAPIDGIFGQETTGGVILFQHRVFLPENGIVEYKTWQALEYGGPVDLPSLHKGSQGELVQALQQRLLFAGDYTGKCDGKFGSDTEAAVKSFQCRHRLTIDGIVGDRTWLVLSKIVEFGC